jgi:hypothetical protein
VLLNIELELENALIYLLLLGIYVVASNYYKEDDVPFSL